MVYRKRYYKRKTYAKPPRTIPWYDRKFSARDVAKTAYSTARFVKKVLNTEQKYHDVVDSDLVNYNGRVWSLCLIAQGDTAFSRTGNRIKVSQLNCTFEVYTTAGAGWEYTPVRLMVVLDTMSDIGTSGAALLEEAGSSNVIKSYKNYMNNKRFVTLYDAPYLYEILL